MDVPAAHLAMEGFVDTHEEKKIYTQEENYRAYKLFSMLDVDSGGSISLRELYRVLLGDAIRYVSCDFDHPDSGIVWGLDEEACVSIVRIEEASLALNYPFLIQRMRIHSINGQLIPYYDPKSLELVYSILLKLHDDPVTLEFLEPMIVINKFSCVLDIEVDNTVFSVNIPVGATYNLDIMKRNMHKELVKVHPKLKWIKIDFIPRKRQIFFRCKAYNFRLLFLTGPNNRRSCRYALGFNAEDTPLGNYHIGQPMLIDLNLGLDRARTEILMVELFNKFDRDGSGEFEFEEFRDFYIRYLDTEESLEYLRGYAKHRFRDLEHEKMVRREQLERENRARRRALMKIKYHDLIEKQKTKFQQDSYVDRFGNRRRYYRHRTKARLQAEKLATTGQTGQDTVEEGDDEGGDEEEADEDRLDTTGLVDTLGGETSLSGVGTASASFGATGAVKLPPLKIKKSKSMDSIKSDHSAVTDPSVTGAPAPDDINEASDPVSRKEAARNLRLAVQNGVISAEEAQEMRKEMAKKRQAEKQLRQKQRRKIVLKAMLEANKALNRAEKADAKKFKENNTNMYLMEAHCIIKRALVKSFQMKQTDFEAINEVSWDVADVVASPAVTIDSAILGLAVDLDNVNVVDMDSKTLHPAALKYFFIRESKKKYDEFNAKRCHPAFFSSDFERAPTRHSRVAQSIAKIIAAERAVGERFREERGIKRVTAVPPEDIIPDKNADQPKRVRFLIDYKDPVTAATVVARLTVLGIRVSGLPSIHLLEDNSPFVQLRCGHFRFSTEINALAGSRSTWDDLNWVFRLHHGDALTLSVLSGTITDYKEIGQYTAAALEITALPTDEESHMHLVAKLMDGTERCGAIEVDFFAELGNEWDWHVTQYKKEQDRLHKKAHTIKKFSRTFQGEDGAISFPLPITIIGMTLLDLKSMHMMKKNRPYVELSCGTAQERTSVMENVLDSCAWDDVRWKVTLVSENANLIFMVHSEKVPMGRFIIDGQELSRLHRNKYNIVEVAGDVKLGEEFTGKMSFKCKLHVNGDGSTFRSGASVGGDTIETNDVDMDYTKDVVLPCVVTLHAVELTELPQVNKMKANSPQVVLTCGYFSSTTLPASNAGASAGWYDMDVSFPIQDKLHIEWKVFSSFVEVGTMVLRAAELIKLPRDQQGMQIVIKDLHNGKDVCGKVRVALSYSLEGRTYTVGKQLTRLQQLAYREPTIAGYGNLPLSDHISSINETTEAVVDKYSSVAGNVLFVDSRSIDTNGYPFRFTVTDIVANDLRAAHLLVKNSPSVRIVCGTVSCTTKEVPRAGSSAIWAGLSAVVFVHANSSVRLSVFSKTVCIGFHTIESAQILDCTPDLSGNREAFLTITDEAGKTSGKLKVTFVLESVGSYNAAPVPFDTSTIRKGLEPPILVNVHTVSLIGLRSVHKYSSNSPFVKAQCGAWQGATTVLDYAGKDVKWREMNWDFVVQKDTPLRLTVQSGTIVIGTKVLTPNDILEQNPNNQGLCEVTGTLIDSEGRTIEAGQVRITYSYEAHIDENSVNSDSESDEGSVSVDAPNNFLTLDSSAYSSQSKLGGSAAAPRSIGHIHLLSITAQKLMPVHALTANSPFLKISCDTYRAVTTTLYRVGASAEWKDLLISFEITRKSTVAITAMSGQLLIGDTSITVAELLEIVVNDAGHTEVKKPLFRDGMLAGEVVLVLHIDRLDRYGFGNSALLPLELHHASAEDRRVRHTVEGEESLELDAKTFKSHDISVSPITIPFVLRIVRVIALDVHPDLRRYFDDVSILRVQLDGWSKLTPNAATSGPLVNLAEWVDSAWVFVVVNAEAPVELAVLSGNEVVGDLRIAISDIVATPPSARGLIELPLYLFRGGQMPCGKVKVCLSIAPYVSPEQEHVEFLSAATSRARTPSRHLGFLRVKLIKVEDLLQVYGLFPNSPKVSVSVGAWKCSTSVAADAGSDYVWNDLGWGRIPIFENSVFTAKVTSGNETLGVFQISALDLFAAAARSDSNSAAVLIEGEVMDGSVSKGRFEMMCMPVRTMEPLTELGGQLEENSFMEDLGEDQGVGGQMSWISGDSGSVPLDPVNAPRTPRQQGLSASTPTPDLTIVSVFGVSVFDLKPLSTVYRNSPVVQVTCDDWRNETTPAKFAGASADWILKRSAAWEVPMRANTFLKLSVSSNGAVLGSVCVSTRELMEVARDGQGLTTIVRDLEHNLEMTGRIRLTLNLTFKTLPPEKPLDSAPSLLTNSFGLPSLASYYPIQKKPSVSNSVMKVRAGKQDGGMVSANTFELELPVNMHIISVICEGIAPSLISSANVLSVVVKSGGEVLQRSPDSLNADKRVEWEDLNWDVPVLAPGTAVSFSVQSSLSYVGEVSLPIHELLSAPRTSQGFLEISRSLRVLGGSAGKLTVSMLLTPYLTAEQKEVFARQIEAEMKEELTALKRVANLHVELISAIDISPMYGTLSLAFSVGEFSIKDCLTFNVSGSAVWGSLGWKDIPLMERSSMVFIVSCGSVVVGKMVVSVADLTSAPMDKTGLAVIYGELMDGLTYRGTMSMSYHLVEDEKVVPLTIIDADGAMVPAKDAPVLKVDEMVTTLVIHAVTAKSLKPVHKVGKNSPMVKIEVRGLKFQSNSLPYAGSRGEWSDLLWSIDATPPSKVKVSITSGSVIVGSGTITTTAMLEKFEGKRDAFLVVDLMKNNEFMGIATLVLRTESRSVSRKLTGSPEKVLHAPENLFHIPSTGDDASEASSAGVEREMMTPTKLERDGLTNNIELFQTNRRVPDDLSLQSQRSAGTRYSAASGESGSESWTEDVSVAESRSLGSKSLRLPSVQEDQPLGGDDANFSAHSTARSIASQASNVSGKSAASSSSRPRTSRGADAEAASQQSARSGGGVLADPEVAHGRSLPSTESGKSSQHSLSRSADESSRHSLSRSADESSRLRAGSGDSRDSGTSISFSEDSVNSSYVYHSADLADHRERTIHTIREGSEASSSVGQSLLHSSRSEDSSTAFDSTISHTSEDESMDRSIYSASNSLSSSAYRPHSLHSVSESRTSRSDASSEFGSESMSSAYSASQSYSLEPSGQRSLDTRSYSLERSGASLDSQSEYSDDHSIRSVDTHSHSVDGSASASLSRSRQSDYVSHQSGSVSYTTDPRSHMSHSASHESQSAYTPGGESASSPGSSSRFYSASGESKSSVSQQQSAVRSGNTASFLLGPTRASTGQPPLHPVVPRINGIPSASVKSAFGASQKAGGGEAQNPEVSAEWKDGDASTIATESAYSEDGDRSESASSARSYSSYSSGPSAEAETIYSGYRHKLHADSERFSDYTSGSSRSSGSSYTSASGESESQYTDTTPRSEYSEVSHSSYASSQHSVRSARPEAGSKTALPQRLPAPAITSMKPQVVAVAPKRIFDVAGLQWMSDHATPRQHIAFTAERMVAGLLRGVLDSFVAFSSMEDYNGAKALRSRQLLTFHTEARGVIRDVAFQVVREIMIVAGSAVMSRRLPVMEAALAEASTALVPVSKKESTKNPYLDGTFMKRAGITLTAEAGGARAPSAGGAKDGEESEEDPIFGGGGLRRKGDGETPQKARITFHDILSIDLSFLDKRIMPKRPYLTACKPYGNWAAETGPAWRTLDGLTAADLVLNWYDLSNKLRWERFILRQGQFLVFDLHDAGSGLIFAKGQLPYSTIINKHMATKSEEVTVFIEFTVANEFGGGKLGGVARMHLDLSVNVFVRSKKPVEFWDTHRSEHWTAFPIAPISTGMVRQKYKEIASDYDNQKVIHPCFFGFRARWRGNPEDEARFIHPMFRGFALTKKPMPKKLAMDINKNMQKNAKPNPWRFDANAAALGRCPVCTDGISGCPRCFMLPLHKNGFPSTADEFAYNPEREREKARVAEQKEVRRGMKVKRRMDKMKLNAASGQFEEGSLGSLSTEHASDSGGDDGSEFTSTGSHYENTNDKTMTLHTNLTTYKALRHYRNLVQKLLTVYVKLVPTGYVRKFVVDSTDTVFHMYNMYHSHSNYGTAHSSMLLIPTNTGMFELHNELEAETDLMMAISRGKDTLGAYGLLERSSTIVMLFIPNYKKEYVPVYLSTFFEKNTGYSLSHLKMYDSVERLPANIPDDIVQKTLRGLLEVEYAKQQSDMLREFVQRGLTYHQSRDAKAALDMKVMKERSQAMVQEKKAMKMRLESQLKGLSGAERAAAKVALKKRELMKKRSVLYEKEKAEFDIKKSEEAVMTRRSRSAGTDAAGRLQVRKLSDSSMDSSRSSGSSGSSASDSSTSFGDSTEDGDDDAEDSEDSSEDSSGSESSSEESGPEEKPPSEAEEDPEEQDQDGPDIESTPILSPRGNKRPRSARSDQSGDSSQHRHKFYVMETVEDAQPVPAPSFGWDASRRTAASHLSSVTGTYRSETDPSASSASFASTRTGSSYTEDSASEYSRSDGTYSSRSGSSYDSRSYYSSRSGSSRPSSASSYTFGSSYSDGTGSYYSAYSGSSSYSRGSRSTGTGSYTSYTSYDSGASYTTLSSSSSYTASSSAVASLPGLPYHQGSSLHSLYSGLSEPPSVHSSQMSMPTQPSLYSGMPPSIATSASQSNSQGQSGSLQPSGSSYTSYTSYTLESQPSSRGSDSTGGLFTYRSALDSLPSSRSGSSYASRDSPRSESASEYSRPSSASYSSYSGSSRDSRVSGVSEASSYELAPSQQSASVTASQSQSQSQSQSYSRSQSQSVSASQSQSRGNNSVDQRTKSSLFSADFPPSSSSYASTDSRSYTTYSRSGSESSFQSTSASTSHIDDISMYSSEVRTKRSAEESQSQDDDASSEYSINSGVQSMYSESGSANSYPAGKRFRQNQFPVPSVRFEASQDSLRSRFERMRKAREDLQKAQFKSVVTVSSDESTTTTVLVPNFYADGSPVRPKLRAKRAVTPPKTSTGSLDASDSQSVASSDSYQSASSWDSSSGSRSGSSATATRSTRDSRSSATMSRSVDYTASASTYASERLKRRATQPIRQKLQQQRALLDDVSESSLESSLDSGRSSQYTADNSLDGSQYTAEGSQYTAEDSQTTARSSMSGSTYSSRSSSFYTAASTASGSQYTADSSQYTAGSQSQYTAGSQSQYSAGGQSQYTGRVSQDTAGSESLYTAESRSLRSQSDKDGASQYSQYTGLQSHSTAAGSSHYTAESADVQSARPGSGSGFVQRKRAHLMQASAYDGAGSSAASSVAGTDMSDPLGSHLISQGSSQYGADASSLALSEESPYNASSSLSHSQRDGSYSASSSVFSSSAQSGYVSATSSSFLASSSQSRAYAPASNSSGASADSLYGSYPRRDVHGDTASLGTYASSSTGTVDYLYRSDVLSSNESRDSWEPDSRSLQSDGSSVGSALSGSRGVVGRR